MHATDIVAYTYRADIYCPNCIVGQLPTGEGEAFEGWTLSPGIEMNTDANLQEIGFAFGFDIYDESTYDSDDFPKVVFSSQVEGNEHCGKCGKEID